MEIRPNASVAIVGAGTMGVGIAQVAAAAGHDVTVLDTNRDALERGRAGLDASLDGAVARGRLTAAARSAIRQRVRWADDLAPAAGAALVIEAIVEDLAAKRRLFGELARIVGGDTVLASNTSSLGIGTIAEGFPAGGRFIGLHFFNPVPAMKLVEIVAGPETDPAVLAAAADLMRAWGKVPVQARDVAGFIVNRVARPFYAEGFLALSEGIEPALIDAAMTEAGGFRMGPLALADMIGHDVNYAAARSVFDVGFGVPRFRPQPAQRRLVEQGRLGRKAGAGVYDHSAPLPRPPYALAEGRPTRVLVAQAGLLHPLLDAARAAGVRVACDEALPFETLDVDGVRLALGDGRTLAARPEVDVILDHVRDFACAGTMLFTARSDAAGEIAAGLLAATGRRAISVPDRPGQLVLRTLAQLANAAADTIMDGIASAEDVETAMRHGANHVEGPLGWVDRIGSDRVRTALGHIACLTADALYTPSPLFGRDH
ncbi:MAG: 3-hydroxyacyl-CoA dehydrogenase NAD-binding domain-containing protein [Sphingomonas sp.]